MYSSAFWGFGLPLFSAITVALVGVLTRRTPDRLAYVSLLNLTVAMMALPLLPFAPPLTNQAMPFLAASALVHWIYQLNMIRTLSMGDLSLAFPIMRGLAPLLIAITGSLLLAEQQSTLAWIGLLSATIALVAFGFIGRHSRASETDPRIFGSAMATAACVAGYTVIDAEGVRAMNPGEGWGFVTWFFLVGGLPTILTGWYLRRQNTCQAVGASWRPAATAGALSFFSYGSALLAMGMIPIAHVAAIRETSVVFAAIFGWLLLKEPFGSTRILLAAFIVAGLVTLKLG